MNYISTVNAAGNTLVNDVYNNIEEGFSEILSAIQNVKSGSGEFTAADALAIQQGVYHYTLYQETITKVVSKAANAINEVSKAQ
ncbi:EscI/YscI/HrpB family type III secretion system inner rod protein [Vibrio cholerae]|uniref:EscI/YscI/HrpB family type III secretion system inner rod protein n=1 Tax=Vibrio cholerae TaxID=666 RepID=UPI000E6CCFE7|nr:EscI/YscI/HrpB family type III secretion system inner rod protein [Vibrio cholerae]EGQ8442526.1 EscI/YscI/HrpB family type III secretion system inner rod protein [Vibrio cholerae]EGR1312103.1 EscI/YscI/HrpB family type III secretion system inner rod protein [Vibrio cholerae]MEB5517856.1 EscI/YscI/HrpB family type III secretion system inner rod protein [Vibrio cholerae]NOE11450.1 EscI/YscI/HrpB family type III secretion system inner rod protein [Vibrio cholerae]NOF33104.1 EscI/YscI/HrpB fami